MLTDYDHVWAGFRATHPEIYSDEIKNSGYWPYLKPNPIDRVR